MVPLNTSPAKDQSPIAWHTRAASGGVSFFNSRLCFCFLDINEALALASPPLGVLVADPFLDTSSRFNSGASLVPTTMAPESPKTRIASAYFSYSPFSTVAPSPSSSLRCSSAFLFTSSEILAVESLTPESSPTFFLSSKMSLSFCPARFLNVFSLSNCFFSVRVSCFFIFSVSLFALLASSRNEFKPSNFNVAFANSSFSSTTSACRSSANRSKYTSWFSMVFEELTAAACLVAARHRSTTASVFCVLFSLATSSRTAFVRNSEFFNSRTSAEKKLISFCSTCPNKACVK